MIDLRDEQNPTVASLGEVRRPLAILLFAVYGVVLLRTAWVGDDAGLTFRSVLNLLHGFGPTFNIDERVQVFTHPLWFFVLAGLQPLVGNIFGAAFVASALASLAAFFVVTCKLAGRRETMLASGIALILSRAFVDYSSSGLENPLAHLLLALLLLALRRRGDWTGIGAKFGVLLGALFLTRPDLILVGAVLAAPTLRRSSTTWRSARLLALGFVPALAWMAFSLVYYGQPFPNAAYAKLGTGVGLGDRLVQGGYYFLDSIARDPVSLLVIGLALAFCVARPRPLTSRIAVAILLHLAYVAWIGGDFMSGRFFSVPVLLAAAVLSLQEPPRVGEAFVLVAVLLAVGLSQPVDNLSSGAGFEAAVIPANGIADERGFYFRNWGLINGSRERFRTPAAWEERGRELPDRALPVRVESALGMKSLVAGPGVHFIDTNALTDPFLARLPPVADERWRPGHFERRLPGGYEESVATRTNRLVDPALRERLDETWLITRGSIFSVSRFRAILDLNLGRL